MGEGGDGNEPPPFQSLVQFNSTNIYRVPTHAGLPWWLSGKESTCQCRRHRFDALVGKIPWRRKWKATSVYLLRKYHGQRSLMGYSLWECRRFSCNLVTKHQQPPHVYFIHHYWLNPTVQLSCAYSLTEHV